VDDWALTGRRDKPLRRGRHPFLPREALIKTNVGRRKHNHYIDGGEQALAAAERVFWVLFPRICDKKSRAPREELSVVRVFVCDGSGELRRSAGGWKRPLTAVGGPRRSSSQSLRLVEAGSARTLWGSGGRCFGVQQILFCGGLDSIPMRRGKEGLIVLKRAEGSTRRARPGGKKISVSGGS